MSAANTEQRTTEKRAISSSKETYRAASEDLMRTIARTALIGDAQRERREAMQRQKKRGKRDKRR